MLTRLPYKLKKWKFSSVLFISLIITLLIPIFILSYIYLNKFNDVLVSNVTNKEIEKLEQTAVSIESKVTGIMYSVATIANDQELINTASLLGTHRRSEQQIVLARRMENEINRYFHHNTNDLVNVLVFYKDQGVYEFGIDAGKTQVDWRALDGFQETLQLSPKVKFFGMEETRDMMSSEPNQEYMIATVAPTYGLPYFEVEAMWFLFNPRILQNQIAINDSNADEIYVFDSEGSVIISQQNDELDSSSYFNEAFHRERGFYISEVNGEQRFVTYMTGDNGWKYIHTLSYDKMLKQSNELYLKMLFLVLIFILFFLFVSFMLMKSITRPITKLVKQMNLVKIGKLDSNFKASGPMESYVLGTTFNMMIERMKELILEHEEKEKQKKKAEIEALQSQINPHFLLNTLGSIKIMATISKSENIRSLTESLSKLLSSTFNQGGMYSSIGDELRLLEHYVLIMKVRFGDEFKLNIAVSESIRKMYILKLLIQPIVENAIIHGLFGKEGEGRIDIIGEQIDDRRIQFSIQDNGVGMTEEQCSRIMEQEPGAKERFNGLGFRNVHQRIELNYGSDFGLSISSQHEQGTRVIMILPVLHEEVV